jgi:uncharacterized membrane protein
VSADRPERNPPATNDVQRGIEPRWPVALVIACFIAITVTLRVLEPDRASVGPHWLVPALEIAMLGALLAADPANVKEHRRWWRRLSLTLVMALAVTGMVSTVVLVNDLITGAKVTESPSSLLASGSLIWLGNSMIFSLIYWLLDSGGPAARYFEPRPYPDFAFTQQLSPEFAPPGWRPVYLDYLVLGLSTSMAFSPTDVMPMAPWAKLTMTLQSLISLTVIALVIARAVNAFA